MSVNSFNTHLDQLGSTIIDLEMSLPKDRVWETSPDEYEEYKKNRALIELLEKSRAYLIAADEFTNEHANPLAIEVNDLSIEFLGENYRAETEHCYKVGFGGIVHKIRQYMLDSRTLCNRVYSELNKASIEVLGVDHSSVMEINKEDATLYSTDLAKVPSMLVKRMSPSVFLEELDKAQIAYWTLRHKWEVQTPPIDDEQAELAATEIINAEGEINKVLAKYCPNWNINDPSDLAEWAKKRGL